MAALYIKIAKVCYISHKKPTLRLQQLIFQKTAQIGKKKPKYLHPNTDSKPARINTSRKKARKMVQMFAKD